jgi:uncharacterized protein
MATDHVGMTILTLHECLHRLRSTDVGRLAVCATPPEVFPVNHVVDHGTVVFRTAAGSKLDAVAGDEPVTFEADGYDAATGDAWSVVVKGRAVECTGLHERFEAAGLPLFPWHDAPKPHAVRVIPTEVSGRRFAARRPTAPAPLPPRRAPPE